MKITRKQVKAALPFDPKTVEIEVTEATGYDMEKAFMAAGKDATDTRLMAAVLANTAKFNGQKLTMEEILGLPMKFLGELGNALAESSQVSETMPA